MLNFCTTVSYCIYVRFTEFTVTVAKTQFLSVNNRLGNLVNLMVENSKNEIAWTCRYKSSVTVLSAPFITQLYPDQWDNGGNSTSIEDLSTGGKYHIIQNGDFSRGFKISTFATDAYDTPVSETSPIFLGSDVFVQVHWALPVQVQRMRFIVYDCFVDIGGQAVDIINDTCYSHTLGALLLGEKANAEFSYFKYRVFAPRVSALPVTTTLTCTLHLCLISPDTCKSQINFESSTCPQRAPHPLDFTATGL